MKNVSKSFRTYEKPQHRLWQGLFGSRRTFYQEREVLRNINLNIKSGETVGIVGVNGAGKSTLLSLVCGIMEATTGSVSTCGKVGALLDLGSGFSPELSGRENLYVVAAIRGFTRDYVSHQLEQILDFADIGEAIDAPVKIYSTGMYMRLAFSLIVHLKPDLLVIDEALAVGDEAFQSRCFQKLRDLRLAGVTILFVSHASHLVLQLCDSAVLMDNGELLLQGEPRQVVDQFHKLIYAPASEVEKLRQQVRQEGSRKNNPNSKPAVVPAAVPAVVKEESGLFDPDLLVQTKTRFVEQGAHIHDPGIATPEGEVSNLLTARENYRFTFRTSFSRNLRRVKFGMLIKTVTGIELGGRQTSDKLLDVSAGDTCEVSFQFSCLLVPGIYFLNAGVLGDVDGAEVFLDRVIDAVQFRVLPVEFYQTGTVDFLIDATVTKSRQKMDRTG
jgi:lipopolysaccharide transport system ATP-binding protein